MIRRAFIGIFALVLICTAMYLTGGVSQPAADEESVCIACHQFVTPGIVTDFKGSKKYDAGLGCDTCHGSEHDHPSNTDKAEMPTPELCSICHPDQFDQYAAGKHALAWTAMEAMPMLRHQPNAVGGTDMKGCSGCHKIGLKTADYTATTGFKYGQGACDSCHTRHSFSAEEARDPRACMTCHMGFDHPNWEMWSTSKHGVIWQIEGDSGRAPTCQTCHMPEGNHEVRTAWGFLALRLPEEDPEWMADRAVILQALGVLDWEGNPTPRIEAVKAADVARLTKEDFDAERNKMTKVCKECHSPSYVAAQMQAGDDTVREADALMAEAILVVKELYDDGILVKPEGWDFAPDILQFYDAETGIEQELWVMFMEFRMRTYQGAFHSNPDYMHWYGWAEMKNSLATIKSEAKALRGH